MFLHVLNIVFITGLLFALFRDFPCLEINLMLDCVPSCFVAILFSAKGSWTLVLKTELGGSLTDPCEEFLKAVKTLLSQLMHSCFHEMI